MKVDTKRNIAMVSNRKGQVSIFDLSLVNFCTNFQTPIQMKQAIKCKHKSEIKGLDFDLNSGNIFFSVHEKKTLFHYQMQGQNVNAVSGLGRSNRVEYSGGA